MNVLVCVYTFTGVLQLCQITSSNASECFDHRGGSATFFYTSSNKHDTNCLIAKSLPFIILCKLIFTLQYVVTATNVDVYILSGREYLNAIVTPMVPRVAYM